MKCEIAYVMKNFRGFKATKQLIKCLFQLQRFDEVRFMDKIN